MAKNKAKLNKFLTGAVTATMVAAAVVPVAAAATPTFSDVKNADDVAAVTLAVENGFFQGNADGTFKPYSNITRGQVAKTLARYVAGQANQTVAEYIAANDLKAAVTPFTDVSATHSDPELYEASLVVKHAGVFTGSNNNLAAAKYINRAQMASVLVRAFDLKDLPGDLSGVVDADKVDASHKANIHILSENGVTTESAFRPFETVKRVQMAKFLNRALEVSGESVSVGVQSIKAINATTVEVAFKETVADINSLKFSIEGLAVSNAAVKQTDSKVVVLTTAVQTGDKEYTVKSGDNKLGNFKGISGVIPTKITMNTTSEQGVVGKEVTLKADIGVKEAGVPVTFNVKADDKLNKDQVVEAVTNAEGIATYSYTQYAAGNDDVAAYPTGAPSVRSLAKVYWGVDTILTIVADDKKGEEINNGDNKVYKLTYKDAKTGKAVTNQKLHVTFAENVDTTIDKITHATANGKNAYQLENGKTEVVTVTTNSQGEATLTVSGLNTKATPVVFVDDAVNNRVAGNDRLEVTELQAKAAQLVIGAVQSSYALEVTRDGKEEAATGYGNGRKYKVVVKTKDGKVAANETVNVSFNEVLDRNMNTNTSAIFTNSDGVQHKDATNQGQQLSVKLNAKGEGSFIIATATNNVKEYATPVVWIDINSSNAKTGTLDEGEPSKVADITYFAEAKLTDGSLKAYDVDGNEVEEDDEFAGNQSAFFKFAAANQSGKAMSLENGYDRIETSFTVWNTGNNDVKVDGEIVSPNRSITRTVKNSVTPTIEVVSVDNKTTSVRVEARGTAEPIVNNNNWNNNNNNRLQSINLGSHTAKAEFKSTKDVGTLHTGLITDIDIKDKEIQFEGKDYASYKGASFKNYYGNNISQSVFETEIQNALDNGNTHRVTLSKDSNDKVTVSILTAAPVTAPTSVLNQRDVTAVANSIVIPAVKESGSTIALTAPTNGVNVAWVSNSGLVSIDGNTATVQTVTKDETVTLTATITKGDAKVTKTYSVKVTPVVEAEITKGQLLGKIEAAKTNVDDVKFTAASRNALSAAILEARAVYDQNAATPAQIKTAFNTLEAAIVALDLVDDEVEVPTPGTDYDFTATTVEAKSAGIDGLSIYNITGTVAGTKAADVVEVKINFDPEVPTQTAVYNATTKTFSFSKAFITVEKVEVEAYNAAGVKVYTTTLDVVGK